jgi:predicted kinase
VDYSADYQLYSLLDFYAAYRAVVKLKVTCLSSAEAEERDEWEALRSKAEAYLCRAYNYAVRFSRPTLYVFCGLPASGKSTLARHLAETLAISHLQTDQIRKERESGPAIPLEHVVPYDQGIYRQELRQLVYARMLAMAQDQLRHGRSVILDGSFSRRKWREDARQLATDLDTNLLFIECSSSSAAIEARLKEREQKTGVSDARMVHLPQMVENFEPLNEIAPETHLMVDTDRPSPETLLDLSSKEHEKRCIQVSLLLKRS